MPGMDGFDVAAALQRRSDLGHPTIVMLTSSGQFGDQARCQEVGIAAYLTKPVYGDDLAAVIRRALRAKSDAPADAATESPSDLRAIDDITPKRVLLVEDNIVNQRVALGLLGRRGHHVTVVENGRDALSELARTVFDVVLMDLQMPVMGGIEATNEIRERERNTGRHQYVVAMTAHAMSGDRERCIAAGMDGYLAKPIDPKALFAAVESSGSRRPAPPVAAGANDAVPVDLDALRARVDGDDQLLQEVIAMFLNDCPQRLAALQRAVEAGDADAIRVAAHAIKGAAGNLAAMPLFNAASTLERLGVESRLEPAKAAWRQLRAEATRVVSVLDAQPHTPSQGSVCAR